MAEEFDVAVKVISQKGTCGAGHKVGDEWVIGMKSPPEGICLPALNALYPTLQVMRFGGVFPRSPDPDIARHEACPDPNNPVVFELRRIRK